MFLKTDKNQKKKKGGKSVDSLSSWKATLEVFSLSKSQHTFAHTHTEHKHTHKEHKEKKICTHAI